MSADRAGGDDLTKRARFSRIRAWQGVGCSLGTMILRRYDANLFIYAHEPSLSLSPGKARDIVGPMFAMSQLQLLVRTAKIMPKLR